MTATILPVVSGDTDLPQLDYATLVAAGVFVPEWLNADLDGEWMFDLTAPAAYRSRVGSAILNPAGKTVSLVTGAAAGNHLQIDSGVALNGLLGVTPDAVGMTYGGLFRYRTLANSANVAILAGSATQTGAAGGEYIGQLGTAGSIILNVKGDAGNIAVSSASLTDAGIVADADKFVFVAATSVDIDGTNSQHTLFVGAPSPLSATASKTKTIGARNVAVGNAFYTSSNYYANHIQCAHFFSGSVAKSVADLTGIYRRVKEIAARRGIVVV